MPQLDEDLLYDLLRHAGVPEQPPGERKSRPGVAPVDLGEGVVPPAGDGKNQALIAGFLQIGSHFNKIP